MFTMSYDGRNFYKSSGFLSKYYDFGFTIYQTERIYKICYTPFPENGKYINKNVISEIYQLFDGIICYIRSMIVF